MVRDGRPERSGLADAAFLLPDIVVLLARLLRDSRVPLGAKAVALGGLGYVLYPLDLLPEFIFGPVGLIDDVLVVSAALSRLVNDVHPDVVRDHWAGKGDALDAIQSFTDWADNLITDKLPRFLRQLLGRSG